MKINLIFAWYDLWIGLYYDRKNNWLYILPFPCCGVVIKFYKKQAAPENNEFYLPSGQLKELYPEDEEMYRKTIAVLSSSQLEYEHFLKISLKNFVPFHCLEENTIYSFMYIPAKEYRDKLRGLILDSYIVICPDEKFNNDYFFLNSKVQQSNERF